MNLVPNRFMMESAAPLTQQVDRLLTINDRHFRRYESEGIIVETPADLIAGSSLPP